MRLSLSFSFLSLNLMLLAALSLAALGAEPSTPSHPSATPSPATGPVLPAQFSGWQMSASAIKSSDAAVADETNATVLKEYGFQRLEKAEYTRDDGRTVAIKAAVFQDASGAYGAFTFYRAPVMVDEQVGRLGASFNNRVLFMQGNVLVDAVFSKLTAMSAAELRDLAGALPTAAGSDAKLPPLRNYFPTHGYQKNTAKYVLGPATLDRLNPPLPSQTVDFKLGAEVMLAKYSATAGEATLMLIEYPTPQIAIEKLKEIDAAHQATAQQPGVPTIVNVGPFFDKRTGPIIVIAAGPLSQSEARTMMGAVSYDADVTWNQNTFATKRDNLANLLFNVVILCGILVGLAVVVGVGFGGARVLAQRLFPGKVFDRPEGMEFISLHLDDQIARGPESDGK